MPVRLSTVLIPEFIGAFALSFIGILAIHLGVGIVGVALAHGLILGIMITAAMPTSGGHLNPAVTFSFLITGKIKPGTAVAYVLAQLAGATVAALAVAAIYGFNNTGYGVVAQGTPQLAVDKDGNPLILAGLIAEFIATFFLVFAVWGTAADPRARNVGGFAIGLTVVADILAVAGISGASMNPSRSFGPQLIGSLSSISPPLWSTHWVYWVGELAGAAAAGLIYYKFLWPSADPGNTDAGASDVPKAQQ